MPPVLGPATVGCGHSYAWAVPANKPTPGPTNTNAIASASLVIVITARLLFGFRAGMGTLYSFLIGQCCVCVNPSRRTQVLRVAAHEG